MRFGTMAEIWALDHECQNLFGTCRACLEIWEDGAMDTIEKGHAEVAVMVKAALDRGAFTAEEIMESVRDAYRVVLEESWQCWSDSEDLITDDPSYRELRARIDALAQDDREPPQQEES